MDVASGFLDDDAKDCYRAERRRRPFDGWRDFKLRVWERFIPKDEPSRKKDGWCWGKGPK